MFQSARIRLTTWYLLIIGMICLCFSIVVFFLSTKDIVQIEGVHRTRQELQYQQYMAALACQKQFVPLADRQLIHDWETQLKRRLLTVNVSIILLSGIAAYFLATQTLKPIQQMLRKQKQFISDASHELRTPITAMKTQIEVSLRDKTLSLQEGKEILLSVLEDVNKLDRLTSSLLHLDNPTIKRVTQRIEMSTIIESVIKKLTPLAKKKNITLRSKLSDAQVLGSPQRIEELIVILLDNAIKYSKNDAQVLIKTKTRLSVLEIQVVDEGEGINDRDLPHIFDRFFRSDKSRTAQKAGGFGLGLSIAKEIVLQHQGSIEARSKPQKGTLFIIKLPLAPKKEV